MIVHPGGLGVMETYMCELPWVETPQGSRDHGDNVGSPTETVGHCLQVWPPAKPASASPFLCHRKVGIHTLTRQDCDELTRPVVLENGVGRILAPQTHPHPNPRTWDYGIMCGKRDLAF